MATVLEKSKTKVREGRRESAHSLQGNQGTEERESRERILVPSSENLSRGAERWERGGKRDIEELLITHHIGLWVLDGLITIIVTD